MTERARPGRPAPPWDQLALLRVRPRMRVEVFLPEPPDLFKSDVVGATNLGPGRALELVLEQHPQRRVAIHAVAHRRRDRVVGKSCFPVFVDETALFEQSKMAR